MQTQITNALVWAEKQITLDGIRDFVPSVAERVSFAALQPVSGKTFIIIMCKFYWTSYVLFSVKSLNQLVKKLLVIGNYGVFCF